MNLPLIRLIRVANRQKQKGEFFAFFCHIKYHYIYYIDLIHCILPKNELELFSELLLAALINIIGLVMMIRHLFQKLMNDLKN